MIFFTADLHLNHSRIIQYAGRPFANIDEMHRVLLQNWNARVRNEDTIYCLGDLGFGKCQGLIEQLNGHLILVPGDHDKRGNYASPTRPFLWSEDRIVVVKIPEPKFSDGYIVDRIILCHWAMRVWPLRHYGSIHLFGHSHGRLPGIGRSMDAGVDAQQFMPVSLPEVISRLLPVPIGPVDGPVSS